MLSGYIHVKQKSSKTGPCQVLHADSVPRAQSLKHHNQLTLLETTNSLLNTIERLFQQSQASVLKGS